MNIEYIPHYIRQSPFQVAASLSASISGVSLDWPQLPRFDFFRLVTVFVALYIFILWVAIVYWAWRDTQDRIKDRRFRRLVIILIGLFNLPGVVIYLILRPPTFSEQRQAKMEEEILRLELKKLKEG